MLPFFRVHSTVWRLVLSLLFHAGITQAAGKELEVPSCPALAGCH